MIPIILLGVFVLLTGGLIIIATEMRDRSLHPSSTALPVKPQQTLLIEEVVTRRRTVKATRHA